MQVSGEGIAFVEGEARVGTKVDVWYLRERAWRASERDRERQRDSDRETETERAVALTRGVESFECMGMFYPILQENHSPDPSRNATV